MKIGIIDYGAGNLRSVRNTLRKLDLAHEVYSSPVGIDSCDKLILPGVGAFGDSVQCMSDRGLFAPVQEWLQADQPFLGICVGYQLLFEESEEAPGVAGLSFLKGVVRRFPQEPGLKVPHMGWNQVTLTDPEYPLWAHWPENPHLYFVHSYYPQPTDESIISSTTRYAENFASSIRKGRVHGVQFHPERSQKLGLQLLKNFADMEV